MPYLHRQVFLHSARALKARRCCGQCLFNFIAPRRTQVNGEPGADGEGDPFCTEDNNCTQEVKLKQIAKKVAAMEGLDSENISWKCVR